MFILLCILPELKLFSHFMVFIDTGFFVVVVGVGVFLFCLFEFLLFVFCFFVFLPFFWVVYSFSVP